MDTSIPIHLLKDRKLLEHIHFLKETFVSAFSKVGNHFSNDELEQLHANSKGIKISKGNDLAKCPYQVLDLVRDFQKEGGFNIRVLNWWGRGIYLFVYLTKHNPVLQKRPSFLEQLLQNGFQFAYKKSAWDYVKIIDEMAQTPSWDGFSVENHFMEYSHLQMVKAMPYPDNFGLLTVNLVKELRKILIFYGN